METEKKPEDDGESEMEDNRMKKGEDKKAAVWK